MEIFGHQKKDSFIRFSQLSVSYVKVSKQTRLLDLEVLTYQKISKMFTFKTKEKRAICALEK